MNVSNSVKVQNLIPAYYANISLIITGLFPAQRHTAAKREF
jgi:hypothetical protein